MSASACATVILSKSATVWEGVKASLCARGVSPSPEAHSKCIPLGGTKVHVLFSIERFDEDQRLSGGNILDLTNIQVKSESNSDRRTRT